MPSRPSSAARRAAALAGPAEAEAADRLLGQAAAEQIAERVPRLRAGTAGAGSWPAAASSTPARSSAALRSASAASGEGLGTSSPASAASRSTASMKPAPSLCMTKLMASPCAPQPKQWKCRRRRHRSWASSRRGRGSSPSIAGRSGRGAPAAPTSAASGRAGAQLVAGRRRGKRPVSSARQPRLHQRAGLAPCPASPRASPFSAAITLPMSLMLAAPVSAIACGDGRLHRRLVHLLRQEALDHRDLGLFLVDQVLAGCPAGRARPTRGGISPCRAASPTISSSGTRSTPFGRAAMSTSFSRARIMRKRGGAGACRRPSSRSSAGR